MEIWGEEVWERGKERWEGRVRGNEGAEQG